jgi:hypothetical protein
MGVLLISFSPTEKYKLPLSKKELVNPLISSVAHASEWTAPSVYIKHVTTRLPTVTLGEVHHGNSLACKSVTTDNGGWMDLLFDEFISIFQQLSCNDHLQQKTVLHTHLPTSSLVLQPL